MAEGPGLRDRRMNAGGEERALLALLGNLRVDRLVRGERDEVQRELRRRQDRIIVECRREDEAARRRLELATGPRHARRALGPEPAAGGFQRRVRDAPERRGDLVDPVSGTAGHVGPETETMGERL